MSRITPISAAELPADLAAALRPRVERLGYLGEFFRYAAHQPQALMSFMQFTEDLKRALPDNLTEVVALSVAVLLDNAYERVQHERLSLQRGLGENWVREVLSLRSATDGILSEAETSLQKLVIAVVTRKGKNAAAELDQVVRAIGPAMTMAVLMLIGRYVTHALIVNTLNLAAPVSSPLETK